MSEEITLSVRDSFKQIFLFQNGLDLPKQWILKCEQTQATWPTHRRLVFPELVLTRQLLGKSEAALSVMREEFNSPVSLIFDALKIKS